MGRLSCLALFSWLFLTAAAGAQPMPIWPELPHSDWLNLHHDWEEESSERFRLIPRVGIGPRKWTHGPLEDLLDTGVALNLGARLPIGDYPVGSLIPGRTMYGVGFHYDYMHCEGDDDFQINVPGFGGFEGRVKESQLHAAEIEAWLRVYGSGSVVPPGWWLETSGGVLMGALSSELREQPFDPTKIQYFINNPNGTGGVVGGVFRLGTGLSGEYGSLVGYQLGVNGEFGLVDTNAITGVSADSYFAGANFSFELSY